MRLGTKTVSRSTALSLAVLFSFLLTLGCSSSVSENKADDPSMKAALQKTTDMYKAKTQGRKKISAGRKS